MCLWIFLTARNADSTYIYCRLVYLCIAASKSGKRGESESIAGNLIAHYINELVPNRIINGFHVPGKRTLHPQWWRATAMAAYIYISYSRENRCSDHAHRSQTTPSTIEINMDFLLFATVLCRINSRPPQTTNYYMCYMVKRGSESLILRLINIWALVHSPACLCTLIRQNVHSHRQGKPGVRVFNKKNTRFPQKSHKSVYVWI